MIDRPDSLGVLGFLAVLLLNGAIATAHSALINARKTQLRDMAENGHEAAKRTLAISDNSTRLLASRQFISITLHFCAAGLLTAFAAVPLVNLLIENGAEPVGARWLVLIGIWLVSAVVMIMFGELVPDAVASGRSDQIAMLVSRPMQILLALTSPFTRVMLWFSSKLASSFGDRNLSYVTEEEIKTLVDAGQEEGVIEDEEKAMIYSIFQFGDKVAREVMIPRIDIVALDANTPISRTVDAVLTEGHSRIPIYDETIDKVIGLAYAKDLLGIMRKGQGLDRPVRTVMRPAYYVPESKRAGALLEELQQRKIHMAIVIDEYGGTAGLVTIEDLLEEIVGEIQDEYDPDEPAEYEKISDTEYLFDAGINLTDVNELMDVELPTDESDTLGGFVFSTLDKVPLAGESFQKDQLELTVEAITGRRIRKVRVRRLTPRPEPEGKISEGRSAEGKTGELRAIEFKPVDAVKDAGEDDEG